MGSRIRHSMKAGAKHISFINHIPSMASLFDTLMFPSLSLPVTVVSGLIRRNMTLIGIRPLSVLSLCLTCLETGEGLLVPSESLDKRAFPPPEGSLRSLPIKSKHGGEIKMSD